MSRYRNIRKIVFLTVALVEFIVIVTLWRGNPLQKKQVLGANMSINDLEGDYVVPNAQNTYKNFYELKPSTVKQVNLPYKNIGGPQYPVYRINNDGLNQVTDYTPAQRQGVFRIAAIGDSFTFGINVNTSQNYPSQLETLLSDDPGCKNSDSFQVFNLGVSGYDLQYTVERFRLRGEKYNPDLIIWLLIDTDFDRINEIQLPILEELSRQYDPHKDTYLQYYYNAWREAENETRQRVGGESNVLDLQAKAMKGLNEYFGGKVVIVTIPPFKTEHISIIKSFMKSRKGISLLQIPDDYSQNSENILPDGHPSPQGYSYIADKIFNYLTQNNIIPCEKR